LIKGTHICSQKQFKIITFFVSLTFSVLFVDISKQRFKITVLKQFTTGCPLFKAVYPYFRSKASSTHLSFGHHTTDGVLLAFHFLLFSRKKVLSI